MEHVPLEVWYAILGWLLATVGTAILRGFYQMMVLWRWEKTVLSRFNLFAYDEERRDIYGVTHDPEKLWEKFEFELVVHIDSDAARYHKCMSHLATHFYSTGQTIADNSKAYVLKPYERFHQYPKGFECMSRKELIEAHEN